MVLCANRAGGRQAQGLAGLDSDGDSHITVRAAQGRLSALRVFLRKSILYGAFVWARRALNGRTRCFRRGQVEEFLAFTKEHPRVLSRLGQCL